MGKSTRQELAAQRRNDAGIVGKPRMGGILTVGMVMCLKRASDEQVARLLAEPNLIESFTYGAQEFSAGDRVLPPTRPGCLLGLLGVKLPSPEPYVVAELPEDFPEPADQPEMDLDKSWNAIHYLLTGDPYEGEGPPASLMLGGEEVGSIDMGYGPARAMGSEETRDFGDALARVSEAEFMSRYDPAKLQAEDVYPSIWENAGPEEREYVVGFFRDLRQFVSEAAAEGQGLVMWLC